MMLRNVRLSLFVLLAVALIGAPPVRAGNAGLTLAVTMTNDPTDNQINVYDANSRALVQTLSTRGRGGVGGNARGVRQYNGDLFAAVNNGSGTVALFRREGDRLAFDSLLTTSSAPVSIDFGNDHLYVAGTTTVDSFVIRGHEVRAMDGSATLQLTGGGVPPAGSTAQVGVVNANRLLVTLKTDPDPGTVDIVALTDGVVTGASPIAVSAPSGTLTPFGFSVYPDGTAVITLAHSSQDGLFRGNAFTSVIAAGQAAPCWTTRAGKYLFTANTGSKTISRLIGTGANVFVDGTVAANIATGGAPSDIDSENSVLGVIDHVAGRSHLSLFTYNEFGELAAAGSPIDIGVPNANGIAIIPPTN